MKDEISSRDNSKPIINIIINIQNSDEPGAHWSAFHKGAVFNIDDKTFVHFWYDSYGCPPDVEIIKKFGKGSIAASMIKIKNLEQLVHAIDFIFSLLYKGHSKSSCARCLNSGN